MKFLTTILCVFILFMTITAAMPVRVSVNEVSCNKSCCATQKDHQTEQSGTNSCCKSLCNPFMSCCGFCALMTNLNIGYAAILLSQDKFFDLEVKLFVIYISAAWHPPQMV